MTSDSTKLEHELFVSGANGSFPVDIILAVLPAVPGSLMAAAINNGKDSSFLCFCLEYLFCIVPVILSFTIFSHASLELTSVLFLLFLLTMSATKAPVPQAEKEINDGKLSCVTSIRATVNICTIIAILAVDFHIFSRRFTKTKTYGYSLMDVGAGCYLFLNGLLDFKKKSKPRQVACDVFVLGLLGSLRLLSVKATNYQQPVTEYGVHCNFFFTLAAIKVVCPFLVSQLSWKGNQIVWCLLALAHFYGLQSGWEEWTLSEDVPRDTGFIEANREWFISLPGNVLIYIAGIFVGDYLFTRLRYQKNSIGWLLLPVVPFFATFLLEKGFLVSPSRRMTNVTFVAWIIGFCLFFLTLYRTLESIFGLRCCRLFESVNAYLLQFFLLGNIFTGLINLGINTLETTNSAAFFILNGYAFVLCYLVYLLHSRQIKSND